MAYESSVSPILAVAALSSVFGALLLMAAAELPKLDAVRSLIFDHGQKLMLAVAFTATASSLYYSEAVGFVPCEFCWFQRIAMYPLFALLLVAVVTRSRIDARYLVVLATAGLALSVYHFQLQLFPAQAGVCSGPVSCTGKYVEEFGLITIPFMAGCGFLTILLLQAAEWRVGYLYRSWRQYEDAEIEEIQDAPLPA